MNEQQKQELEKVLDRWHYDFERNNGIALLQTYIEKWILESQKELIQELKK